VQSDSIEQNAGGIDRVIQGEYPVNFHKYILHDTNGLPNYLVVGNNGSDWTTVSVNSFKKLHEWGRQLCDFEYEDSMIDAGQKLPLK
jgi:hypothetical protein